MKLRHQIMLLIMVPILFQAFTVGLLMQAVSRVDASVKDEQRAKDVITDAKDLDRLINRCVLSMAGASFGVTDSSEYSLKLLQEKFVHLKNLVSANPDAVKIVVKQSEDANRLLTNLADLTAPLARSDTKLFLAQFSNTAELKESLMINFDEVVKGSEALIAIYKPMTGELHPQAVKARADFQKVLFAVMISSIILVAAIAYIVNKQTLSRLQVLMQNIRDFSQNKSALKSLQGTDELAELDQAFQTMSMEKFRLDEIQKSLRAMVSHDLRSPLSSMTLTLELILDFRRDKLDEKTTASLRRMYSEVQRLSRLAKTLLDIEKLEGGHINVDVRETDWESLIGQSVESVNSLASQRWIAFDPVIGEELAWCDRDRTIQCVVNLVSNAIKFSPAGATVKILVCPVEDGFQRVEVIDCGPGVPASKTDSLFKKFIQLEQSDLTKKEGSGLGLYICRLLIEAQGGTVGYRPAEPSGSCFFFKLPARSTEDPPCPHDEAEPAAPV